MDDNDLRAYKQQLQKERDNRKNSIRDINESHNRKRLATNRQTRASILTAHFSFAIFFFIILIMTKENALAFIAAISWIFGKGISYLFVKFLPITLNDLDDNYREINSFSDEYFGKK